ncbi:hypothetical protein [Plantactinospora sp. BC1]|uniref:hypothetical protein n=1 Tax=Plantactinospora sp. BC1 TaxID=2108470 RepID=UPI00131F43FE|nr:hypothetical protein [Plantactinospora sp. BC1]
MELRPPAQSDRRQGLSKAAEMVVSAIPGVGGPLGIVLADVLARPYNRRMEEWLTDLAVALRELEERVGDFEHLANNEAFVDAVAAGTRIAERSRREKRELLRNAVLNTALAVDPDEDRQHVFFDLIDRLPPVALRLLKFLADPQYREDMTGSEPSFSQSELVPVADIAHRLSPIQPQGDDSGDVEVLLDKQCERLRDEGLLDVGALSEAGYNGDHRYFAHHVRLDAVTRFGRSFVAFIEDPRDHDA